MKSISIIFGLFAVFAGVTAGIPGYGVPPPYGMMNMAYGSPGYPPPVQPPSFQPSPFQPSPFQSPTFQPPQYNNPPVFGESANANSNTNVNNNGGAGRWF